VTIAPRWALGRGIRPDCSSNWTSTQAIADRGLAPRMDRRAEGSRYAARCAMRDEAQYDNRYVRYYWKTIKKYDVYCVKNLQGFDV
jgi:hypothetical protein